MDLVAPEQLHAHTRALAPREALKDVPTVSIVGSAIPVCREIERALLDAGVLAYIDNLDECSPISGCGAQYAVIVAREDAQRAGEILEGRFRDLVEREGTGALVTEAVDLEAAEVTCPACGHQGALDDEGACADCGLMLGAPG